MEIKSEARLTTFEAISMIVGNSIGTGIIAVPYLATRNSILDVYKRQEGIVSGGGVALVNTIPAVKAYVETLAGDVKTGAAIIARALEEPVRQIAETAAMCIRDRDMALT